MYHNYVRLTPLLLQVMKGYYKNDEATAETIDSDNWLHTGDIARVDSKGNFYIVDRLKELIKVKGFQVKTQAHLHSCSYAMGRVNFGIFRFILIFQMTI